MLWVRLGDFSSLGDALLLGNGCSALHLGGVGLIWNHKSGKEGVNYEVLVYREVLMRRRIFVTSVELVSTVGSFWCRSRLKGVCLAVLSGVSSICRPVLGIPKWRVVHILLCLVQ